MVGELLQRRFTVSCVILFSVCALLTYGGSLSNGFVTLDDNYLIYENPVITRITPVTLKHMFTSYDPELYAPLTTLSYAIDYALAGLRASMVHAQSLLWHTLNALLVAWLLKKLTGNALVAVLLGLLFLLHPQNAEAVAWASARKDVLSTFFFLSSILAYLRFRETDARLPYWLSIGLFVLGLFSKVVVLTLPVVLLLLDWREGRRLTFSAVREKWPYFIASAAFGVIALFGKTGALVVTTAPQKIFMALHTTWFTLITFFVPRNLSILYPYTGTLTLSSPDILFPALGIVLLIVIAVVSLRWTRELACAVAFFILTLAPAFINFAKGNEIFSGSDRYGYIPMVGILILLGVALDRLTGEGRRQAAVISTVTVLVFALVLSAWAASVHASAWRDSETLFRTVLETYPESLTARNNLGMAYLTRGENARALAEFDRILERKPWPIALVNRGLTRIRMGDSAAAIADYRKALEIDPFYYDAYYELGNIAYRAGQLPEAAALFAKAYELNPQYGNALNNLGATQLRLQQWDRAAETFRRLLTVNPNFTEAYYNLAVIAEQRGDLTEAEEMYERALALHPDDPDAAAGFARVRQQLR